MVQNVNDMMLQCKKSQRRWIKHQRKATE